MMKNKYVKIKGHDNWFLVLEKGQEVDPELSSTMQERMFRKIAGGVHNPSEPDWASRIVMAASRQIDYQRILDLGPYDILVRPFGSWMPRIDSVEITKTRYSEDFPIEKFATIVVCENDADMPYRWNKYLQKRFPGESIEVINFFDTRSDNVIKEYFKHAKYVTFTTTFTTMEWWELLVRNLQKGNKVIGSCKNKKGLEKALKIYSKVEIVKIAE